MPVTLEPLLAHVPAWMMVLTRLSGLFLFAPVFGSVAVPMRLRALLVFVLALCVYPTLLMPGSAAVGNVLPVIERGLELWTLLPALAMEVLIGLVIGLGASMPLMGLQLGGRMIDQQMGLGIGGVINPELGEETGVIGEFMFLTAVALFVIMGGHRVLLAAVVGSFAAVPLGGYVPDGQLVALTLGLLTAMFDLGLRVAAPVLCLVFLETVAMGFIARTVPQMNILSIGFALRILMGSALLMACVRINLRVAVEAMRQALSQVTAWAT